MKFFKLNITLLICFSLLYFLWSCNQEEVKGTWESNIISSLEDDVMMIASIDYMKITDESGLLTSEHIPSEYQSIMKMYIENTLSSDKIGVQLEGNNHIVFVNDNEDSLNYAFALFNVINSEKIDKRLKLLLGGKMEEEGNYKYLITNSGVFGWDDKHLVAAYSETIDNSVLNKLKSKVEELLDTKEKSIVSDIELIKYLERTDDMNMLIAMDPYFKMVQSLNNVEFELSDEYYTTIKDAYILCTGNFNDGSIIFQNKLLGSSISDSKFNIFGEGPVNEEYLNYLTDNNRLLFYGLINLNLSAYSGSETTSKKLLNSLITDLPELMGVSLNSTLDEYQEILNDLELEKMELKDLFDGQISLSVMDLQVQKSFNDQTQDGLTDDFGEWGDDFFSDMDEELYDEFFYDKKTNLALPKMLMTIGLKDKDLLLEILRKASIPIEEDGVLDLENNSYMLIKEDKLFIGSPKELLNKIQIDGRLNTYKINEQYKHPFYACINTDKSKMPDEFLTYIDNEYGSNFITIIKEILSIQVKGSSEESVLEIRMKEKNENALKRVINLILVELLEENPDWSFI